MAKPPTRDLVYAPATRGNVGILLMLSGPPGSGKTKSALRLATGLAGPDGLIGLCDTEHGRARYYADEFNFQHLALKEPFDPGSFEQAALASQRAGHVVWICDSFSHEHVGPGGVLDMHETELQRMAGDDYDKRDRMKMTAWIKPKAAHKGLLQRLWQLNSHIILCCHAERKTEIVKNDKGKLVPVDRGYQPVCSNDIPYAMTASFMFSAENPGVPMWLKRFDKLEALIDMSRPLDEGTGRRLAEWASGTSARSRLQTEEKPPSPAPAPAPSPAPETSRTPPEDPPPATASAGGTTERGSRNEAALAELIALFNAVTTRAEHFAIVDTPHHRDRISWFKQKKRGDMYPRLEQAIKAAWDRGEPAAAPEPPPPEEPPPHTETPA